MPREGQSGKACQVVAPMDMLVAFEPKAGQPQLGKRMASKVDAIRGDRARGAQRAKVPGAAHVVGPP